MRAITVHRPWAWAIAEGLKTYENRSWYSDYTGRLLIHAGTSKGSDVTAVEFMRSINIDPSAFQQMPRGAIVAVVDMVGCEAFSPAPSLLDPSPVPIADPWAFGPYCFRLANVTKLAEPVPCKGQLGLWNPTAGVVRRVTRQFRDCLLQR
ncbi:ASCH domain-containing protein [Roseimaritima ulvae]|uniref:ASCH domain protein n=1 Tax=Roseimaritima ulvae TaxID=980254 RepID=A0A5B9QWN3_9BACT|nr:ASCH domain-containing protein [Roseimaritima ulvae]QEG43454.1 ASCH domain protein [Roseimaritima ulvae]